MVPRARPARHNLPRSKTQTQTQRDTAQSANPLILGVRNRIYTGSDPTGCVCLEMEQKREAGSMEAAGPGAEGTTGGLAMTRRHCADAGDRVSAVGAVVCRAWEP